jgi:hypothetical protein
VTTIRLLGRHLTAYNHESVLDKARRRSKREVELLVAQLAPRPDVPSSVRKLPVQATVPQADGPTGEPPSRHDCAAVVPSAAPTEPVPAPPSPPAAPSPCAPPVVSPLSTGRYRVQVTVGEETHDKLRRLQDLLRREIPSGDPAVIVDRALTLLLQDVEKRKLAATSRPRRGTPLRNGDARGLGHAVHTGTGSAGGLETGRRSVRILLAQRPPVSRPGLPGDPPYPSLCPGRPDDTGQPWPALPPPQRPRGGAGLRARGVARS